MEITIDSLAIALSGMPGEAFFAADQIVRDSFRHQAMQVKPLVDAAYAAGREDAAKVADEQTCEDGGEFVNGFAHAAETIAAAIRALPGEEGAHE